MGDYLMQQYEERELAIELAEKHGLFRETEMLKEQLNDANDIIDFYFPKIKKIHSVCIEPLKLYRKKWGVK